MKKPVRFLEGASVYLRPFEAEDLDWYFDSLHDCETRRLTGTQKHFTREQIVSYMEGKREDSSSVLLLIAKSEDDALIGDIALQDIDPLNRNGNIRIALFNSQNQGKGYGTEALELLMEYGFGILNLHRIELNVYDFNKRAAHVYGKLGFKEEGIQREALYYNHAYHDSILMSILEEEYREIRGIGRKA